MEATPEAEPTKEATPEAEPTKEATPEPKLPKEPTPEPEPPSEEPTSEPEPPKQPETEPSKEPKPEIEPASERQEVSQTTAEVTVTSTSPEVTPGEDEVKEKSKPAVPVRTKVYTTNPAEGVDIAMGESEIEKEEPLTIPQLFKNSVQHYGSRDALGYKEENQWKFIQYTEYYQLVISAAKSFIKVQQLIIMCVLL